MSDFRPADPEQSKIKKGGREGLHVELEPTTDVLAALSASRRPDQTVVGFAAEHGEQRLEDARAKLEGKGLDAVVLNDISRTDAGFDAIDNEVTILTRTGRREVSLRSKTQVASVILDEVEMLRAGKVETGP